MTKLRFGAWIPTYAWSGRKTDPKNMRRIRDSIVKCEKYGIDVWVIDHLLSAPGLYGNAWLEPLTVIAYAAALTTQVDIATGILVLPLRNPVVLAKTLASLDHLSRGRLILGCAAGWYKRELDAVGIPFTQRGRVMERNLEILTRLWTEDRVTLKADEFNLRDAAMVPKPCQRPRPPILIGGYVDAVLRRVARRGDGWLTYFYTADSFRRSETYIAGQIARAVARGQRSL